MSPGNVPDYAEVACTTFKNPHSMEQLNSGYYDNCGAYATINVVANAKLYQNNYTSARNIYNDKLQNEYKTNGMYTEVPNNSHLSDANNMNCNNAAAAAATKQNQKPTSFISKASKGLSSSSFLLNNPRKSLSKMNITENKMDLINNLNRTPSYSSNYASSSSTSRLLNNTVELMKTSEQNFIIPKRSGNLKNFKSENNINFGGKLIGLSSSSTKLNSSSASSTATTTTTTTETTPCSSKTKRFQMDVVDDDVIADMLASETCYIATNCSNISSSSSISNNKCKMFSSNNETIYHQQTSSIKDTDESFNSFTRFTEDNDDDEIDSGDVISFDNDICNPQILFSSFGISDNV